MSGAFSPGWQARSYQGMIRQDGFPRYVCDHHHASQAGATSCSKEAWTRIRASRDNTMPPGWHVWSVDDVTEADAD